MDLDQLPPYWEATTISALVESKVSQDGPAADPFIYIDIGSVDNVTKRIVDPKSVSAVKAPSRARQRVRANDLLVSMTRPNLNAVAKIGQDLDGAVASTGFDVLRPKGDVSAWLFAVVRSHNFVKDMSELVQGALYPAIRPSDIRDYPIPLPPEAEQRRIVAKLDALQSRTRLAREALAAIPTLLDHYRQSVLAAAFRGDLTRDMRAGQTDEGIEDGLPLGWTVASLGDLAESARIGLVRSASEQFENPDMKTEYVRMGHYDLLGRWNLKDITYVEVSDQEAALYSLRHGDVLFNTRNSYELVGKVAIWDGLRNAVYNNNLMRIRFSDPALGEFIGLQMQGSVFQSAIRGDKSATTSVCAIYNPDVLKQSMRLPPDGERTEICRRVTSVLREIDQIHDVWSDLSSSIKSLDQSLLATAFRGELVPQDPTDEPASILLDRIRAARAQANDTPTTRHPRRTTPATTPRPARAAEPAVTYHAGTKRRDPYITLLTALRQRGSLANADAQAATGLDAATVRPLLQRLVADGAAKVAGQKRGTRYVVI